MSGLKYVERHSARFSKQKWPKRRANAGFFDRIEIEIAPAFGSRVQNFYLLPGWPDALADPTFLGGFAILMI